jgi:hypothetical protein
MNAKQDFYQMTRCERSLEQIDREVARLSLLCRARIFDTGVIEHILQGDMSVCGANNAVAFRKLRELLMLHFAVRAEAADKMGQVDTMAIETLVVERLMRSFPGLEGRWPPS